VVSSETTIAVGLNSGGQALASVAGGFAGGAVSGGAQGAVLGAINAFGSFGIGEAFNAHGAAAANMSNGAKAGHVAAHAALGCGMAAAAGGSCRAGGMAAGFSALAGHIPGISDTKLVGRMLIGGVASKLGGGEFANGALSAAFEYLYNYCGVNGCTPTDSGNLRGTDPKYGSGAYGAGRGKVIHEGQDFLAEAGQEIVAPVSGRVSRSNPYRDDSHFTGIRITTEDGTVVKTFYVKAYDGIIGTTVKQGQPIGTAQDLQVKYPGIPNHVHTEVWLAPTKSTPLVNFIGPSK
jgi:hypothetical protein